MLHITIRIFTNCVSAQQQWLSSMVRQTTHTFALWASRPDPAALAHTRARDGIARRTVLAVTTEFTVGSIVTPATGWNTNTSLQQDVSWHICAHYNCVTSLDWLKQWWICRSRAQILLHALIITFSDVAMKVICAMLSTVSIFSWFTVFVSEALCKYIETLQKLTKLHMINLPIQLFMKKTLAKKNLQIQNIFTRIFTKTNGNRYSNINNRCNSTTQNMFPFTVTHCGCRITIERGNFGIPLCRLQSTLTITSTHVPCSCFLWSQANIYRCPSQRRTSRPVHTHTSLGSWYRTFRVDIL